MWCIPEVDAEYLAKMEDVLAIYEKPLNSEQPVVCLDEKPVCLRADIRPSEPAAPGKEAHRDNEYTRHGTANVFCAVEPKSGRYFTWATPNRSGPEFAQVIAKLSIHYRGAGTIHLVVDNLNTHRRKSLTDFYGTERGRAIWDRFTIHYTPKHGSWLNQAEIAISLFSRQCLGKRRIPSFVLLKHYAQDWNRRRNQKRTPINWQFDRKTARTLFGYTKNQIARSEY